MAKILDKYYFSLWHNIWSVGFANVWFIIKIMQNILCLYYPMLYCCKRWVYPRYTIFLVRIIIDNLQFWWHFQNFEGVLFAKVKFIINIIWSIQCTNYCKLYNYKQQVHLKYISRSGCIAFNSCRIFKILTALDVHK